MGQLENLTNTPTPSELLKELSEWALAAGRFFQSSQTGFVHLYYSELEPRAQTIPLVENVLFVLALFRSRLVEQIQEGKGLLKKLILFQSQQLNHDYGNFPVYLHEYPVCQNPALGLQLLAPFYWILTQFGHILGTELKSQLEQTVVLIVEHSIRAHQAKAFPYSLAIRLGASQLAYGLLWNKSEWQQAGNEQLETLAHFQLEGWHTTKHLADILVGLQMVYPSLANSPWSSLWLLIEKTWHTQLACYIGPCIREWQDREQPQVNLHDLFAGYFSGQFSHRASVLSYYHLHGILIQPSPDSFNSKSSSYVVEGKLKQQAWTTVYHQNCSYSLLEKKEESQPALDKMHTPYRFVWGNLHFLHSLVCQGGHIEKVEYQQENHSVILLFDLKDQTVGEENIPKKEIEFFVDFHPDLYLRLNNHAATTFELGQTLQLLFNQYQLSIAFELIQGEGNFLGHIMRGNRPSQTDAKGEKRFQAYDWTFFLRTIRRKSHCKLQVQIKFEEIKDFDE